MTTKKLQLIVVALSAAVAFVGAAVFVLRVRASTAQERVEQKAEVELTPQEARRRGTGLSGG